MIVTLDDENALRIFYYDANMQIRKEFMHDLDFEFHSCWTQATSMYSVRLLAKQLGADILHDDGED